MNPVDLLGRETDLSLPPNGEMTGRLISAGPGWATSYFGVFHRLRSKLVSNNITYVVRHAPLRVLIIFLCSALIWWLVFGISLLGMKYLRSQNIQLGGDLVGIVFNVLFLALTVLLIFSTGIILYSSLFASSEAAFLLCSPAPADAVFAHKYQGAVAFSSWSVLLLGSPILIAYGIVEQVPFYYYFFLPFFFLGFILLPGSVGAVLCLLIVNFIPKRKKQAVLLGLGIGTALAFWWGYRTISFTPAVNWDREMLNRLLDRFSFARGVFMPSHWMVRGLQAAGRGAVARAFYYLALVWTNGLMFYLTASFLSVHLYRRGYNRLATGGTMRRRYGGIWIDRIISRIVGFLHPQTRLLIIKDFRTFRRDPAQWAQILIFTGLMTLYFTNIRRMYLGEVDFTHQNSISLLNLCATGLLLAAYTGRFIYPMLSLEGRKFWILGLLPMKRERLLWGKFAFSATGGIMIAESLVLLSDWMLGVPWPAIGLHILAVAVLAFGLSGMSVGLGACMPNFRESDPSKIAVGFGGTVNLIAGLLFLALIISLIAAPWHIFAALAKDVDLMYEGKAELAIAIQAAVGVFLGAVATMAPLLVGSRMLKRMEF